MLSSDKNVETIAQLAEIVKHYLGIQTEYLKLDVVDKLVRLLTFIALSVVFLLILLGVAMFCSFAFAFWLSSYTGTAVAFLVVRCFIFFSSCLSFSTVTHGLRNH